MLTTNQKVRFPLLDYTNHVTDRLPAPAQPTHTLDINCTTTTRVTCHVSESCDKFLIFVELPLTLMTMNTFKLHQYLFTNDRNLTFIRYSLKTFQGHFGILMLLFVCRLDQFKLTIKFYGTWNIQNTILFWAPDPTEDNVPCMLNVWKVK